MFGSGGPGRGVVASNPHFAQAQAEAEAEAAAQRAETAGSRQSLRWFQKPGSYLKAMMFWK